MHLTVTSASAIVRADSLNSPALDVSSDLGCLIASTVAGPFLTGVVTSGSYTEAMPQMVPLGGEGEAMGGRADGATAAANRRLIQAGAGAGAGAERAAGAGKVRGLLQGQSQRGGSAVRSADRCVVLLPAGMQPDRALMASLHRRDVEVLVCFDAHDVVARLCVMTRQFGAAQRRGLRPLPGGIALVVCEPGRIASLASVVHAVRRYASRCVCWQFTGATAEGGAVLRPLGGDEILRAAGEREAGGEAAAEAETDEVVGAKPAEGGRDGGHGGADLRSRGRGGLAGTRDFAAEREAVTTAVSTPLRLSNWATLQADNRPQWALDTLNVGRTSGQPALTCAELAMLLGERSAIAGTEATSHREPESGTIGSARGPRDDGGFRS